MFFAEAGLIATGFQIWFRISTRNWRGDRCTNPKPARTNARKQPQGLSPSFFGRTHKFQVIAVPFIESGFSENGRLLETYTTLWIRSSTKSNRFAGWISTTSVQLPVGISGETVFLDTHSTPRSRRQCIMII
jgi:hypothetical protein